MHLPQMLLHVPGLLSKELLEQTDRLLPLLQFTDGRSTASGAAQQVKNNLQVSNDAHQAHPEMQQLIGRAILSNPLIKQAVMPSRILPPIVSKYESGMHYGWHTDSPLMGTEFMIRADVSITVFLNHPTEYEGGDLVVHTPSGFTQYKLEKGDAVIYPTTRLHAVKEIMAGNRIAAVTWLQCAIKNPEQRELLFQFKAANDAIGAEKANTTEYLLLQQVYSNLVRMWSEI